MSFTVSINPTYYCNFNCDFCYLSEAQLNDRYTATIDKIRQRLDEVTNPITHIDLYGGEIGLLPNEYLDLLIELCKQYTDSVCIITNLSAVRAAFLRDDIQLSVSYDFDAREKEHIVFNNMLKIQKPFNILTLASRKVVDGDVDFMVAALNSLTNLRAFEIKPFSQTTHRSQKVSDVEYEEFVKKFIDSELNCEFTNQIRIEQCLDKEYNAFSNDHVYITPNSKFAVLEFDKDHNEYFLELDSFDDYLTWAANENISDVCKACKYYGHCLTEHYKYVESKENSCNGYYNLLEWYDEESV